MSRRQENSKFVCENCKKEVHPLTNGSYRNHCPYCLYSKHVDIIPGDRENQCMGMMKPVRIKYHSKKGNQIIHKCLRCKEERVNKVASNTIQNDSLDALLLLF